MTSQSIVAAHIDAVAMLPAVIALAASAMVHLAVNGRLTVGAWSGVSLAGQGLMLTRPGDEAWLPSPLRAAEMALIRLCYAADLPSPSDALKALQNGMVHILQKRATCSRG